MYFVFLSLLTYVAAAHNTVCGFSSVVSIALTREEGNNFKLKDEILKRKPSNCQFEFREMPCITFESGEDTEKLESWLLNAEGYLPHAVIVTSPQVYLAYYHL